MTQYLVEVRVPALGCRFDARLPNDITFGQAAQLLWAMAKKLPDNTEAVEDGAFKESTFRAAPYFDLKIDGITLLDTAF